MKRPIIGAMLFLIFGILIGQYSAGIVLFFALLAAAVTGCLYIKFRYWPVIFFIFFFVLGAFRISISVKPQDKLIEDAVHDRTEFIIKGVVQDTGTTSTGNPKCVLKTETVSFLNNSMQKISMNVNVYLKAGQIVNVGDVLILTGELQPLAVQRNPGGYNEFAVQRARGIEYKMFPETAETVGRKTTVYAVLNFVKMKMASVYDNVLPEKEASIMKSIILGDKAGLDGDVGDMYRSAGIYHLLCISGLHISILLAAIYFALGKLFNKRSAGIIALVIMIFYCIMTGSGISTVRAVTMCGIAVLGRVLFRDYDILNTVCLTCAALLIHQPLYLHDVGFQLSFGAVFGIAVLSDPFTRAISMTRLPLPNAAKEFFAVNFAATLTTYPILAYHFYHLASYSLIVNAIILPSAAFLVIVGFCVGLIGLVTINGAVFVSGAVYFLLKAYENICLFFVSLPGSVWLTGSVGIFVLIFAFCVLISAGYMFSGFKEDLRKRVKIFCSAIAAFIIAAVASSFNPGLTLTMLDAGQGDAFILQAQNRTFLIDAGGMKGDRVLLPFLDYRGIKKADGLLLTSASPEHITGAFCLVENGRIDAIYMPAGISNDQIGMKLLTEAAARYQVPVVFLESGSKLVSGDLQITALIPEDKNESMMAVKLSYKNISVMLPGDLSPFAGRHGPADTWRADVAAMPSHGDRSRSEVDAAVILISRGWRYPRWIPDPYDILQNEGTAVFSTYRNGAVTLHINGKTVRVTKMIE